ncbi:hypothetical protein [Cellulosimicrobium sp. CUA-896]|uniref:hypothetical protein n=1 Tax=Cellulosimicrobium sp. CUA-896 TaxID=1517881 RepID=UPI00095A2A8F|nr:hypothetical protein [Cellulosimicrobium sp. CUA-896]OLT54354.1 hypothetical protein BJF88_09515 [Cellulosimicrobium sp. CUA-896]
MRIELTVTEAVELARAGGGLPPFVRTVTGEGDDVRVALDLREVPDPPSALRLAARLVPVVRVTLRLESFVAGTAVVAVEANAAGLPAHKLLGIAEGPLQAVLRSRGLPPDALHVLPGARVAVDAQALLAAAAADRLPGARLTDLAYADGTVRAEAVL